MIGLYVNDSGSVLDATVALDVGVGEFHTFSDSSKMGSIGDSDGYMTTVYRSESDPLVMLTKTEFDGVVIRYGIKKLADQDIHIPRFLEEALLAYAAYLYFLSNPSQETQQLAATNYARYREICLRVEDRNLLRTGYETSNTLLETRGWR